MAVYVLVLKPYARRRNEPIALELKAHDDTEACKLAGQITAVNLLLGGEPCPEAFEDANIIWLYRRKASGRDCAYVVYPCEFRRHLRLVQ